MPQPSDASFQIPHVNASRLADVAFDFDALDDDTPGLDADPFATPVPAAKTHTPLTLSDITPRGERERAKEDAAQPSAGPGPGPAHPVDDMFERRKRDNYQQMGIDLTSKSTARLRHRKGCINLRPERSALTRDAGIVKHKPAQPARPKSILKPARPVANLPPSTLLRTLTALEHTPKSERPQVQHLGRRDSSGSGGGGLMDVLVMYGEKLKGSLGFSSSGNAHGATGPSTEQEAAASSRPLTLSDLTPRRQKGAPALSSPSPSPQRQPNNPRGHEQHRPGASPMRPARKRTQSTTSRESKNKKGRPDRPRSAAESTTPGRGGQPLAKAVSKPNPLRASHAVNGAHGAGAATHPKQVAAPRRTADKEQHAPRPTGLAGPAPASDVSRQRSLDKKTQRRAEKEKERERSTFNAGAVPYFSKPAPPARPAVRPTVPAAFTFRSDARAAHHQRTAEFEERRRTWEARATHQQARPMPDFAAMHAQAAQAGSKRAVVPVLPTEAPALTTMVRARERERFEEERRARERAVERLRAERERERATQDEEAYRAARKRTVPRAHEVPGWYKDVPRPKRREVE